MHEIWEKKKPNQPAFPPFEIVSHKTRCRQCYLWLSNSYIKCLQNIYIQFAYFPDREIKINST